VIASPISIARPGDAAERCEGITLGMTDSVLVRAALDGDDRAFTTLVDRHAPACLRFARRMLGEMADAEDAAQETFLRAFNALRTYDASTPFRTWLFAILVNRCRTSLLRRSRRERRVVMDELEVGHAVSELDPARAFEFREEIAWALGALPVEQREAFLLKHVEELSYDEMVVVTGAGASALRMRVKRACDRLQILLDERGRNGTDAR
jgi:RNA polymerase sigma-70 factor (ECF subfamily)